MSCTIPGTLQSLSSLDELLLRQHFFKFSFRDKLEALLKLFIRSNLTCSDTDLAFEQVAILFDHRRDQRVFAHTRGTHHDEWLVLQRRRVKGMEILLSVHKHVVLHIIVDWETYGLVQQDGGCEVIHDFTDFGVALDAVGVRLDKFFLAHAEVGEDFVVEVGGLFHIN